MVAPGTGLRERSSLQGKLPLQQGHRSSWVRRHTLTWGCSVEEDWVTCGVLLILSVSLGSRL